MDWRHLAGAAIASGVAGWFGRAIIGGGKKEIDEEIKILQEDLVHAQSTPDPADDEAVKRKLDAKRRLRAFVDGLPDIG